MMATSWAQTTLRIGHFPNITHIQALVAHNMWRSGQGWFEQRLGSDVKVEWYLYNADPSAMEAVFAKSIDLTLCHHHWMQRERIIRSPRQLEGGAAEEIKLSPASEDGRWWNEPMPNSAVVKLYREAIWRKHRPFIPILRPNVTRIIYPRSRRFTNFIDEIQIPIVLSDKSQTRPLAILNALILT
jgi:hypothetical protein